MLDEPVPLYGDGRNVRDWLFVEDNVRAIDLIVDRGTAGEVYNIAGGNERTNRHVTETILELVGKTKDLIEPVKDRVGHDRRYSIDGSKIGALGFAPQTSFEDGIELTVRWYRENDWLMEIHDHFQLGTGGP